MAAALKLYDAVDALQLVRDWVHDPEHAQAIVDAGGELPPELAELLDLAEGDFRTKVERVALYIRELLATAAAVDAEAKRLAQRCAHLTKAAEAFKNGYLKRQMERAGETKVEGALVTVRVQRNAPAVKHALTDEQLFQLHDAGNPFVTCQVSYRLDGKAVLAAWKDETVIIGQIPAGVTVEQGTHVRIS